MKKYTFLLKPALFIFNLLFATWMVFAIERIHPSDFGRYGDLFDTSPASTLKQVNKKTILRLCIDYKAGLIDSLKLQEKLDHLFATPAKNSEKQ